MLPLLNAFVLLLDAVEDLFWLGTKEKEEHGDKRAALLGRPQLYQPISMFFWVQRVANATTTGQLGEHYLH